MELQAVISEVTFIICNILSAGYGYLFYRVLLLMLPVKEKLYVRILVYISCVVLARMVIYPNDVFNITLDLLWFSVMVLIAFEGSLPRKFAAVAVLYPLIIALNFLVMDILTFLYFYTGEFFALNIIFDLIDAMVHILFWFVILKFFQKRLMQIGSLFDSPTWLLLGTVCTSSMVSITTCIYFSSEKASYKFWLCALACIVTNISCLYLAEYFANSIKQNMERKNLKIQQDYYRELEQNQLEIRKFRHDMNNHLGVIKSLLVSGSPREAEAYFKEISAQTAGANRVFCKNSIVNAVLNAKYNQIIKADIDCFFHIDLKSTLGIDDISLCSLFANTLDNALEASLKIEPPQNRKISVKARSTENGYFSYEISNTKVNPVCQKKGNYISDKVDSGPHGLGISNIQEIVSQYHGTCDISYTDDSFTVTILIRDAC